MSDFKRIPSRTSEAWTRNTDSGRTSRPSLLEGLNLPKAKRLDVDLLLCELAGESETRKESIFKKFAEVSGDSLVRRDAAMDLIVALRGGNTDAVLALGHLKAKEGVVELLYIAQRGGETEMCRNAIKALCMFGRESIEFVDEITKAFMECDGLEKEAAMAISMMDSFGLSFLCTAMEDTHTEKKRVLAAVEAIGSMGVNAKDAIMTLERKRDNCTDRELQTAIDDAIKKING